MGIEDITRQKLQVLQQYRNKNYQYRLWKKFTGKALKTGLMRARIKLQ